MTPRDPGYVRRAGLKLRGLLNDLKRDEAGAARELGLDPTTLRCILAGNAELPFGVVARAADIWPLNPADLLPPRDDTPLGVRVVRDAESVASSRVLNRGGAPYYEYRDTAMTRLASFRPEWIRPLQAVDGPRLSDPSVHWNDGHFFYQLTYFAGDINFYFESHAGRRCVEMAPGDSCLILPYVPHTFAQRDGASAGAILALTFGGRLHGPARDELAALGTAATRRFCLPTDDFAVAQGELLRRWVEDTGLSAEVLAVRSGLARARLDEILLGDSPIAPAELAHLASALGVEARDLTPRLPEFDGAIVHRAGASGSWRYPGDDTPVYQLTPLAGSRFIPAVRGLVIHPLRCDPVGGGGVVQTRLHQYGYALGPEPVELGWVYGGTTFRETLEPGASFYVKPLVPHWLASCRVGTGNTAPAVLVLRSPGYVTGDAVAELSAIGAAGCERVTGEGHAWYDERGRT